MKVEIRIGGPNKRSYDLIEEFSGNMRQTIRQTFFFMGRDLKKKTRAAITSKSGKTGTVYNVRTKIKSGKNKGNLGRRRRHRSSAPGETHANLSGDLRDSLGWKAHNTDNLEFGYGVTGWEGDADQYADIEIGNSRVAARPSLKNNIENVSFETFFEKALDKIAR